MWLEAWAVISTHFPPPVITESTALLAACLSAWASAQSQEATRDRRLIVIESASEPQLDAI